VKSILVAFDGSDDSMKALKVGAELASRLGASLSLVYVSHIGDSHFRDLIGETEFKEVLETLKREGKDLPELLAETGRKVLQSATAALADYNLDVKEIVKLGHPAEEIIKTAEEVDADIVVVGPHSERKSLVMGSVGREVVERCPRSVLVAR